MRSQRRSQTPVPGSGTGCVARPTTQRLRPVRGRTQLCPGSATRWRVGSDRAVFQILSEQPERGPGSPLLAYDAWARRAQGDLSGARELLRVAPAISGQVGWERGIVAARTAALDGDRDAADRLLSALEHGAYSQEMSLAVRAARIRLAVDLATEIRVQDLQDRSEAIASAESILSPADVVLPLARGRGRSEISHRPPYIPVTHRGPARVQDQDERLPRLLAVSKASSRSGTRSAARQGRACAKVPAQSSTWWNTILLICLYAGGAWQAATPFSITSG